MSLDKDYTDWADSTNENFMEAALAVSADNKPKLEYRIKDSFQSNVVDVHSVDVAAAASTTISVSGGSKFRLMITASAVCEVALGAEVCTDVTFLVLSSTAGGGTLSIVITNDGASTIEVDAAVMWG